MPRDDAAILDMLNAAERILNFKGNLDKTTFMDDPKTQSAILHQLLVVGEAVKRLSEEFRSKHPRIPWTLVAGMRDKLIHEYDAVDLDEVWNTINADIPRLIQWLRPLAPSEA
jgi:uncharacterized protein with HEPN domain